MFIEWCTSVDSQGRMVIPPAYREPGRLLLTFDGIGLISGVLPEADSHAPTGAIEVRVDKRGRITIPKNLRKRADISGAVVFVGSHTGDYFEI